MPLLFPCYEIKFSHDNAHMLVYTQASRRECILENYFLHFSPKAYVVGTQKNHLNETVLLSTQNICLKIWVRKYLQFYAEKFCLSKPMYTVNLCAFVVTRLQNQVFSRQCPHASLYSGLQIRECNWKTIFFISHPKHIVWVLKRTVSMRRFF